MHAYLYKQIQRKKMRKNSKCEFSKQRIPVDPVLDTLATLFRYAH